jgi:hypothetical protein
MAAWEVVEVSAAAAESEQGDAGAVARSLCLAAESEGPEAAVALA